MVIKKRLKLILIGLLGIAFSGTIAYGANLANQQQSATVDISDGLFPIRTWSKTDCSSTPWVVTDQLGFFKEEGLKVVYTGDTQPAQQIPSILNGDNDVGSAHPNTILVAVNGGAPIKGVVIGGIDPMPEQDPKLRHMFWYVNPEKTPNVHTFADLQKLESKIKTTATTRNICTDFLTNSIADRTGVDREKFEWVTMPDIQAVQALKQGMVTVSSVHPPFYKSMEDAGMVKIADSLDAGLGVVGGLTYYYFTDDFIAKNPDIIRRFSRAIAKGQRWANEHPEEARKMTEDWIKVPVNATHYYATSTTIDESQIDPWLHDLEEYNVIPKGKLKSSDIVIHDFE